MAEADALAEGLNAEYDAIRAARERIEQSDVTPEVRAQLLSSLAVREARHAGRVAEYDAQTTPPVGQEPGLVQAREAREQDIIRQKVQTAQAQGAVGVRHTPSGGVVPQQQVPQEGAPEAISRAPVGPELMAELESIRRTSAALAADPSIPDDIRRASQEELRRRASNLMLAQGEFRADRGGPTRTTADGRPLGDFAPSSSPSNFSGPTPTTSAPNEDGIVPVRPVPVGVTPVTPVPVGDGPGLLARPPGYVDPQTATPVAGTPGAASTGAPRGTGGGRGAARPQTTSLAEQLLASLQNGGPDQDELLQKLVDSYRREGTTRQDLGEQGALVVDEGLAQQEELAAARMEEWQQELVAQERRLQEIDTALGVLSSTRFDANRLFTDRGLATSMALGVAVNAATSLAQNALFPGANAGNTALQIVNGAIERDIQTQMVNYERGVQSVQGMRTAYEMARNLSGDRQAAYEFAAAVSQRRVGEQLRSMAMQTQGLVAREQLMRQADSLLLQAAQREELARMQMAQSMMAAQPRGGAGGAGRGTQATIFAPYARISQSAMASGIRTPADVLKALGTAGADRLRDFLSSSADVIDLLDQIRDMASNYSSLSLVDRSRMTNLVTNFMTAFKEQAQLGALDAGVERVLNQIISNPNSVTTTMAEFQAQLRNQRAITASRIRRRVHTLGGGILEYDPSIGFTAPQSQEPGVTIVGETPPQEATLGSVATVEGGARSVRAIRSLVGDTVAGGLFGDAILEATAEDR